MTMSRWISICVRTMLVVVILRLSVSFFPAGREAVCRLLVGDSTPQDTVERLSDVLNNSPGETLQVPLAAETKSEVSTRFNGTDVLLVVGTNGNDHQDIEGMQEMVRQNRQEFADF